MPPTCPREIPSQETILTLSELSVLNENGRAVTFGSLFERQKTITVFIRTYRPTTNSPTSHLHALPTGHFWCAVSGFLSTMSLDHSYWRLIIDMPGNFSPGLYFGLSSRSDHHSPT